MGNIWGCPGGEEMSDVQIEVAVIKWFLKESVEAIIANLKEIERNNPAGITAFSI